MTTDDMIARLMIALFARDAAAIDNLITALEDRLSAEELVALLAELRARLSPPPDPFDGWMLPVKAA